ncbi:hypothetical protein, conserved [Babesia bigemina]|uniref:Uncharacterized protein n=1 Tax=Babesia bigemina TaxID=5866 RepID=A0A061DEP6_BABBI|nr:hypothetical protein, conserved [Babesia bigemina]CDR97645.1 hypothetical protein, conserved [Babesia bigemina]|eukprot:XP_012769831.1 hypothetical protein, conserved [Babesia bigemina]
MHEDVIGFLSRLVPRRTATLYFIFFVSTLLLSIGLLNGSENLFRSFTSCRGEAEYNISAFTALVVLQCILLLPKSDESAGDHGETSGVTTRSLRRMDRDGAQFPSKNLGDNLDFANRSCFSNEGFVSIICEKFSPRTPPLTSSRVAGGPGSKRSLTSCGTNDKNDRSTTLDRRMCKSVPAYEEQTSMDDRAHADNAGDASTNEASDADKDHDEIPSDENDDVAPNPCAAWMYSCSICWNSLWMSLYHFVSFMGIHATLLASRIHGTIELNKHALETCVHLRDKFPLHMWSPRLGYQLISESTFFLTYMSCTSLELVIRKYDDASYLKNFFTGHFLKERRCLGIMRILLQAVIFLYAFVVILASIFTGYGSPMQILCGFSMGMLMLWINSLLTQLLQLSDMSKSTLDFNWLWSLLSLLNFWICGVLFYVSVYGIPLSAPYIYLQVASWIPLLILTTRKGKQIFMWQDISSALYTFN